MRLFVQCFIIYLCTRRIVHCLNLGDICTSQSRTPERTGFCRVITNCPSAINGIREGNFPVTCGFQGSDPIVCCFDDGAAAAPLPTKTTTITIPPQINYNKVVTTTKMPHQINYNEVVTTTTSSYSRHTTTTPPPIFHIVVKPQTQMKNNATNERISLKKCKDYSEFANFRPMRSPLSALNYASTNSCDTAEEISETTAAKLGQFPHAALIGYSYMKIKFWKCGGTLLSEQHILTAASCAYSDAYGFARYVKLGAVDFSDKDNGDLGILEIVKHANYDQSSLKNDIALIKLVNPVKFNSFLRPACLPTSENLAFRNVIVSGWGTLGYEENNLSLKKRVFNVMNCKSKEKERFCLEQVESNVCVADKGSSAVIYSDVYCSYTVVGIVSSWDFCGIINKDPTFTRVSKYIDWIESNIW